MYGIIIILLALLVLSVVSIIYSVAFMNKNKPAFSIAAAVVGAISGAKAISMFIMFGFITDVIFVAYLVIIVYLNYKKNTKSAANNIENGFTESKQDSCI